MSQAKVVTPRAELAGEVLIGETCLYFIPDNPDVLLHTDVRKVSKCSNFFIILFFCYYMNI